VGAGTELYFAELNRSALSTDDLDFVSYSMNPQIHAFDDPSLIENAHAHGYTVESAKQKFKKPAGP